MNTIKHYVAIVTLSEIGIWLLLSHNEKSILFLVSVAIHEIGHLIMSVILGNKFNRIRIRVGGIVLLGNKGYSSYGEEAAIALGGPLFNAFSATLALFIFDSQTAEYFALLSLALAVLNLLPIKGFDGGHIAECLIYSVFPRKLSSVIFETTSFLVLFSLWSISVYLLLKTGKNLTFFVFSFSVFTRLLVENSEQRICEIIED